MQPFVWPCRVYYEDTDAGGIVYYANYLKFMERARTEWLRSLGVEQSRLKEEQGLIFVVVDVEVHYAKPARYDDELLATCEVEAATRASLTFRQGIYRDRLEGELLVQGSVRVACLDAVAQRPRPLPESILSGALKK
jgi:acyl-CoA thioester hydrolase